MVCTQGDHFLVLDLVDEPAGESNFALTGVPGTPGWAANEGGLPIGGAALFGCEASQDWNAEAVTTCTVARISE